MRGLKVSTTGRFRIRSPSTIDANHSSWPANSKSAKTAEGTRSTLPVFTTGLLLGLAAALVGVRVGALGTGPVLSMLLVVGAVVLAGMASISHIPTFRLTRVDAAFILYIASQAILEIFNASALGHPPFVGGILFPVIFYLGFVAARLVVCDLYTASIFLKAFASPLIFMAPLAVAQVFRVPGATDFILQWVSAGGFEQRFSQGWDIRGTATVGHHTQFGGVLICLTGAICANLLISRIRQQRAPFSLVLVALAVIASATTMTFAVIGGVVAIVFITFLQLGARLSLLVGGLGAGIASWTLFGQFLTERLQAQTTSRTGDFAWLPETLDYRMTIWLRETIPAILERPLSGWGIDVYSRATSGSPTSPQSLIWNSPESEYFRTLVSSGWLGLAAQLLLLVSVLFVLIRIAALQPVFLPITASFVVLLLVSTTHSHFTGEGAAFAIWPIIAVVLSFALRRDPPHVDSKSDYLSRQHVAPRQHQPFRTQSNIKL